MTGPTPWLPLSVDGVARHRKLYCPLYEECITEAALLYWEGFTCVFCSLSRGNWTEKEKEKEEQPC